MFVIYMHGLNLVHYKKKKRIYYTRYALKHWHNTIKQNKQTKKNKQAFKV